MVRPLGHFQRAQSEIDAMLGDMGYLRRVDEPCAAVRLDHDAIEDVFVFDRQHLLNGSHELAVTIVDGGAGLQCLIGNWTAGIVLDVHSGGTLAQLAAGASRHKPQRVAASRMLQFPDGWCGYP